jgi:hypothetical protein
MENEEIGSTVEEPVETVTEQLTETRDIIEKQFDKLESAKPEQAEVVDEQTKEPEKQEEAYSPKLNGYRKEEREELAKLPPNIQKMIDERETRYHNGVNQYKEAANYAKTLDNAFKPYKDYMQSLNVTPDVAIQNLMKTEHTLRMGTPQAKVEMFQKLAHDYGIDINAVAQAPFDPYQMQLKAHIDYLNQQNEQSQRSLQSVEDARLNSTIEQFATNKPFFDEARNVMADLLDRGLATDLDDAYNKALRFDENLFAKSNAQQQTIRQDQAAKAAKAQALQIKGSPVGANSKPTNMTTEEAVRFAMAQHGL